MMMKVADKVFAKIALPVIALAGILMISIFVLLSKGVSEQNNAYIRVINCIVSYPATIRTQTHVEQCYQTVEQDLNVKLQRYDNSNQ